MIYSLTFEYDKQVNQKKISREVTEILTKGLLVKGGEKNEREK